METTKATTGFERLSWGTPFPCGVNETFGDASIALGTGEMGGVGGVWGVWWGCQPFLRNNGTQRQMLDARGDVQVALRVVWVMKVMVL